MPGQKTHRTGTCGCHGDMLQGKCAGIFRVQQGGVAEIVCAVERRVKGGKIQDGHGALVEAHVVGLHRVHQVGALAQRNSILAATDNVLLALGIAQEQAPCPDHLRIVQHLQCTSPLPSHAAYFRHRYYIFMHYVYS